jgi:translation initiation factor IF-1
MVMSMGLSSLLVGCDGSKPGLPSNQSVGDSRDDTPRTGPIIRSARILPTPLTRAVPVEAQVEAEAPNLGPVTIQYQWLVNGAPVVGETSRTFDPAQLNLGDRVSLNLTPIAAGGQGPSFHVEDEIIQKAPPVIKTIAIQPSEVRVNTPLQAYVEVVDVDHDLVRITFRWQRNNQVVKESEEGVLSSGEFRAGDVIVVEATPADPDGTGKTVRSEPVTILNSPPIVTTTPPPPTNLESYEYAVHAVDPDGDPMRFNLAAAPSGMTINESSGRIVWRIPSGLKGTHTAKIVVEDGQGGSVRQDIQLTLPAPPES